MNILLKFCQNLYSQTLGRRRLRALTKIIRPYLPKRGLILDIGCGNGQLSRELGQEFPELRFHGADVFEQNNCAIPFTQYDGFTLPFEDKSFDYSMLITVFHHTDDYRPLLKEAIRVARTGIIILDHVANNTLDHMTLCLIDWPGNVPFGVYTPYNFFSQREWSALFAEFQLEVEEHNDRLFLFGHSLDFLFGRRLHFMTRLRVPQTQLQGSKH